MLNDPIADMLTRIRNAVMQKHRYVDVSLSKMNLAVLSVLKESGFVSHFVANSEKRVVRIYLKYEANRNSFIQGLKRVSSPGRRVYVKADQVPVIRRGLGLSIVSTSQGIMSGKAARKENIGGELLCCVW